MPGANYMGGKRNAAKARVKDAVGRLEKTFFGQRRLCALSKGLLASKPNQRHNVPLEESSGFAGISLGHAKQRQKIPSNNDVFIPSPVHIPPCTPRSRRRTRKRLEEHSSSSDISKSAVLDALDVSEPMFLRRVLDRILTMPDLAGISGNRMKPTVATGSQLQVSDESSPLQWTKRKRSPSDLYEESETLRNERPSSSLRDGQSYAYESICTPFQNNYTNPDQMIVDKQRIRTFKNLLVEDDMFPCWNNTSSDRRDVYDMGSNEIDADDSEVTSAVRGYVRSSPWSSRDYRSSQHGTSLKRFGSNYTPYSNPHSRDITNENESHTSIPTSIVGCKDHSAKRSMVTAIHPVEEQTVYGTLFEQDDPWDAIGQILGLTNTEPSKNFGEVIDDFSEIEESKASLGPRSAVEAEELDEGLTSVSSDEIPQVQYAPVMESRLIGLEHNRAFPRCDSLEGSDKPEIPGYVRTTLNQTQLSYLRKDVEESEDDQDCLSADIEDERLFPPTSSPQHKLEVLKSPDRIKTAAVELDFLECREQDGESKSILAIPELQELDGIFMGPSLFSDFDEDEDEI